MSVLADVKAFCGIAWDNYDFDVELRAFINAALSTLTDLGVGPKFLSASFLKKSNRSSTSRCVSCLTRLKMHFWSQL